MSTSFTNITEIALRAIPSTSKMEIKRVLESLYSSEVDKVRTLNIQGKKKKRDGLLITVANKQSKSSVFEDGETKRHWLDQEGGNFKLEKASNDRRPNHAEGVA